MDVMCIREIRTQKHISVIRNTSEPFGIECRGKRASRHTPLSSSLPGLLHTTLKKDGSDFYAFSRFHLEKGRNVFPTSVLYYDRYHLEKGRSTIFVREPSLYGVGRHRRTLRCSFPKPAVWRGSYLAMRVVTLHRMKVAQRLSTHPVNMSGRSAG